MSTLKEAFAEAMENYRPIPEWALEHAVYPYVWSGKKIEPGDKVLYAFVDLEDGDDPVLMALLEREIDELENIFEFTNEYHSDYVPILKKKKKNVKK